MASAKGTRMRAQSRALSGFTIVELLATIAIIAILAAISLPRFSTAAPFAARGYADELANALMQARNIAIASSCEAQFFVDANGYQATQRSAGANNTCNPAGAFTMAIRRSDGGTLAGWPPASANVTAARTVIFRADGTVSGAVPPAISVPPFTITVAAGGWVQVQ